MGNTDKDGESINLYAMIKAGIKEMHEDGLLSRSQIRRAIRKLADDVDWEETPIRRTNKPPGV